MLAIRNPIARMQNVVTMSAATKLHAATLMVGGKNRLPASTIRITVTNVKSSLTMTWELRIVSGWSGVARRRLRMPPSR
jgi:hypothetical protein